jgi:hypothetical protein
MARQDAEDAFRELDGFRAEVDKLRCRSDQVRAQERRRLKDRRMTQREGPDRRDRERRGAFPPQ